MTTPLPQNCYYGGCGGQPVTVVYYWWWALGVCGYHAMKLKLDRTKTWFWT